MKLRLGSDEHRSARDSVVNKLKAKYPEAFALSESKNQDSVQNLGRKPSRKGLRAISGTMADDQLKHLLRRTRFSVRDSEFKYFQGMSVEDILNSMFTKPTLKIPVNNYNHIAEDGEVAAGTPFIDATYQTPEIEVARIVSLKAWVIDHLMTEEKSIYGSMWIFWQSILVVESFDVFYAWGSYRFLNMLHEDALGSYKDLIYKVTVDPTMLLYLNGHRNHKDAPDENYARELQELFCVGKGKDAGYTESDVQEAARLLTGWRLDEYGTPVRFRPHRHDVEDKKFSSFYGDRVIEGRVGQAGADETQELIDIIFQQKEVARYICRRLYIYFVYNVIDEWVENQIIAPLADAFYDAGYDISVPVRMLLSSEHFMDKEYYGALIKSPIDAFVGSIRSLDVPLAMDDPNHDYDYKRSLLWQMGQGGMLIGDPPNVAGWPAFYQIPSFDKNWITTSTIQQRTQSMDSLVWWGIWTESGKVEWQLLDFTGRIPECDQPDKLVSYLCTTLMPIPIREETQKELVSILLSGQENLYYWTAAWLAYIQNPNDMEKRNTVYYRLADMYQRFFQLPEYQLK